MIGFKLNNTSKITDWYFEEAPPHPKTKILVLFLLTNSFIFCEGDLSSLLFTDIRYFLVKILLAEFHDNEERIFLPNLINESDNIFILFELFHDIKFTSD